MVGKVTPDNIATGSTIAAIMGHSKYQTPYEAYMNAVNERPEWEQNLPAKIGDFMEDFVLTESAEVLGVSGLNTHHPEPYWHGEGGEQFLAVSLDGMVEGSGQTLYDNPEKGIYIISADDSITLEGRGILEAKTTRAAPVDVPPLYRGPLQLQAQMLCTDAKWGAVCTLYQGSELRIYVYKANPEMQQLIIKSAQDFKRRVEEQDPYPALSSTEAAEKYPVSDGPKKIIDADTPLKEKIEQLAHIRAELKAYEKLSEDLQVDIMESMQDADECVAGRYKVVWPVRNIKAKPEQTKTIPAVEAQRVRGKTLQIKEL